MSLTTTQHSALGDLRRYESLRPSSRAFSKSDGRRAYSRRTLQALVDNGYAEWRPSVRGTRNGPVTYDGFVTPLPVEPARFTTSYMDKALYSLPEVIEQAKTDLANVDFDTLVGTGFSGGVVIPALALALGKNFLLIRKESDDSHHGGGRLLGSLGSRWIFVDDFVCSGNTKDRVLRKVAEKVTDYWDGPIITTYVGDYLYCNAEERFRPAETAYNGYNNPVTY